MPTQGPGTKAVLKGLNHTLPDTAEQQEGSRERQGPGTNLVLKGLKRALPGIAERSEKGKNKQGPPILENRRYHDQAEDKPQALVRGDASNRRSRREDMDRQEEADRWAAGEDESAPQKRTTKRREHNEGTNRDKHIVRRSIREDDMSQHQHARSQRNDRARGVREEEAERRTRTDQTSSRGSFSRSWQPSARRDGFQRQSGAPGEF
ncbi:MAG: hypothetical protein Q9175_002237 [Cornicularia normoerica]